MSIEAKPHFIPREVVPNSGVATTQELVSVVTFQVKELIQENLGPGLNEIAINAWEPETGYYPFSGIKKLLTTHPELQDTWFEQDGKVKQSVAEILKCCVEVDLGTNLARYKNPLPTVTSPSILTSKPLPPKSPYTDSPDLLKLRRAVNHPKTPW